MKKQIVPMLTILATLVLFSTATAANNQTCNNATLQGVYIYSADGLFTETPGQGPFIPIAEAGIFEFDGQGNLSSTNTISFGGLIFPRTETGTYTVDSDCTGSGNKVDNVDFDFYVARSARSIRLVVTTPGVVVTATLEKQ